VGFFGGKRLFFFERNAARVNWGDEVEGGKVGLSIDVGKCIPFSTKVLVKNLYGLSVWNFRE